jgi:hypothetical protein
VTISIKKRGKIFNIRSERNMRQKSGGKAEENERGRKAHPSDSSIAAAQVLKKP